MANSRIDLDLPDQVQRFLEAISNVPTSRSTYSNTSPQPVSQSPRADDVNGNDSSTADDLKASSHGSDTMTPDTNRSPGGSELMQVTPSPHLTGLLPPQNTPQTMPHSPRHVPISDTIPEEPDDMQVIFKNTSDFHGKPLSKSMWAPESTTSSHQETPFSSSDGLIPTKIAEFDDSIHELYGRMSFKAADPEHEGGSIVGDRVPTDPFTKYAASKMLDDKHDAFQTASSLIPFEHSKCREHCEKTDPKGNETPLAPSTSNQIPQSLKVHQGVGQSDSSDSDCLSSRQRQVSLPIRTKNSQSFEHSGNDQTTVDKEVSPALGDQFDDQKSPSVKPLASQSTTVTGDLAQADKLPPHLKFVKSLEKSKAKGSNEAQDESSDISKNFAVPVKSQDLSNTKPAPDTPLSNKSLVPSSSSAFLAKWLAAGKKPSPALGDGQQQKENSKAATSFIPDDKKAHEILRFKSSEAKLKADECPNYSRSSIEASSPNQATSKKTEGAENLEHKLFFQQWPKSEERDRGAAQIRTVTITQLPSSATASFVISHVFGGPIEHIHVAAPSTSSNSVAASIRFLHAADCTNFYNATSNGLVYVDKGSQNAEKFALVNLGKDVDVIGGLLGQWIQAGATRCVRAIPVDAEYGREHLWKIAERKGRKLEGIEDSRNEKTGARFVIWRFCDIKYAVEFKAALARDEEWEICNISYADDPCARVAEVRF